MIKQTTRVIGKITYYFRNLKVFLCLLTINYIKTYIIYLKIGELYIESYFITEKRIIQYEPN